MKIKGDFTSDNQRFSAAVSSLSLSVCRFRLMCQTIIAHKLFDYVVLAFIFLNCITVALERPRIHQGSLVRFVTHIHTLLTAWVSSSDTVICSSAWTLSHHPLGSMELHRGETAGLIPPEWSAQFWTSYPNWVQMRLKIKQMLFCATFPQYLLKILNWRCLCIGDLCCYDTGISNYYRIP